MLERIISKFNNNDRHKKMTLESCKGSMEDETCSSISASPWELDVEAIRGRVRDLSENLGSPDDVTDSSSACSKTTLNDCSRNLENKVEQILSEFLESTFPDNGDWGGYTNNNLVDGELKALEEGNREMIREIGSLSSAYIQERSQLESQLEAVRSLLDSTAQDVSDILKGRAVEGDELEKSCVLEILEGFKALSERVDAIEAIEDALSGTKLVGFDDCLTLSMRTYLPNNTLLLLNHQLSICFSKTSSVIESLKLFPHDGVYLGAIVDGVRELRSDDRSILPVRRSLLEWIVREVRARIIVSSSRRALAEAYNLKSGHWLEYDDMKGMMVAHMAGGVNVIIKPSHGWPLLPLPLTVVSINCSDDKFTDRHGDLHRKANSFEPATRLDINSFLDAIEFELQNY